MELEQCSYCWFGYCDLTCVCSFTDRGIPECADVCGDCSVVCHSTGASNSLYLFPQVTFTSFILG